MDVDGTLTDGKIYMGADGESFKAFDIKDGYALHTLLKEHDIIPVIITARKSPMVEHRCKELGVTEIHQGIINKLDCLKSILEKYSSAAQRYDLSNVAYIGDDLLDLRCMNPIKEAGGLVGCPLNAVADVANVCDYVAPHKGGEGGVRDFAEYIIKKSSIAEKLDDECLNKRLEKAISYIANLKHYELKPGRYEVSDDFYYTVLEYEAVAEEYSAYESHRNFIDIQWVYDGAERLMITDINTLIPSDEYDEERDVIHYYDSNNQSSMILKPGGCAILFPKDAHKPSRFLGNMCKIKKVVGKLKIEE